MTNNYGNLVISYVDDVMITTPTLEDHIERLDEVFACMKRAGLKCRPSKSGPREGRVISKNKKEFCEALKLGMLSEKGMYVVDTDASVLAISGILHQEQDWNGKTFLRSIA